MARSEFDRWLLTSLLATLLITVAEWVLLASAASASLDWPQRFFLLPALMFGNLLGYVALAGASLSTVFLFWGWLYSKARRPRLLGLGLFWLGSIPYASYVSWFTFSGPRLLDLWYRPLLVAGGALVVAAVGSALFLLSVWSPEGRRLRSLVAGAATLASVSSLGVSAAVLPNEYEPLHTALMVFALFGACIASRMLVIGRQLRPRIRRGVGALALLSVVAAVSVLGLSQDYAWAIWSGTPGSRYLTQRVDLAERPRTGGFRMDRPPRDWGNLGLGKAARQQRRRSEAPDIIVFSVDNLQADRVGAYGYTRNPTTPNIDRIAKQGVVFERAYSYYPQTRQFMSSMLLGRKLPTFGRHRPPRSYQKKALTRLLKKRDYHVLVKGVFELTARRDFTPSDYAIDTWLRRATTKEIRQARTIPHIPLAERFALLERHIQEAQAADKPLFIWMHFLRPHRFSGSFLASEDFPFGEEWSDKYDSAVAATDRWLKKIEDLLTSGGRGDRPTVWIVQSDHGAGLWQGKHEKGKNLQEDHVHVPLIIKAPGVAPGRVGVPVDSAVDTAATILDLVGLAPPRSYDGATLVPILQDQSQQALLAGRAIALQQAAWTGAIWGDWKLVSYRKAVSLFDLENDPWEERNLASAHPEVVSKLRSALKRRLAGMRKSYGGN